jgi:hypothetical protein
MHIYLFCIHEGLYYHSYTICSTAFSTSSVQNKANKLYMHAEEELPYRREKTQGLVAIVVRC